MNYSTVENITSKNLHQMDDIDNDTDILVVCLIDDGLDYEFNNLPTTLKYLVFPQIGWTNKKIKKYFPKIPFDCKIIKLKLKSIKTYEVMKGVYIYFSVPKILQGKDLVRQKLLCCSEYISVCSFIKSSKNHEFWILFKENITLSINFNT